MTDYHTDEWRDCYGDSWSDVIIPEAMAHPAKFSRALIHRIYSHVIAENWIRPGDSIIDPFGGVGLGALDAMAFGFHWYGCELEQRFVNLGQGHDCDGTTCSRCADTLPMFGPEPHRFNGNIEVWRRKGLPGTAQLFQGDSRRLIEVIAERSCQGVITSPPYGQRTVHGQSGIDFSKSTVRDRTGHSSQVNTQERYGDTEGNLDRMPTSDHALALASPPYGGMSDKHDRTKAKRTARRDGELGFRQGEGSFRANEVYGESEGQLGSMDDSDVAMAICSPPYAGSDTKPSKMGAGKATRAEGTEAGRMKGDYEYGDSEGQLGIMKEGTISAAISSPPYPQPHAGGGGINVDGYSKDWKRNDMRDLVGSRTYQGRGAERTDGNLETDPPDTFWAASRAILEQLFEIIQPGGHAVFVTKSFVRKGAIVDFPGQWARLCEAVGFRLLHDHHALLSQDGDFQPAMSGFDNEGDRDKQHSVSRKSFFRRLHEAKRPDLAIEFENVLCFERP